MTGGSPFISNDIPPNTLVGFISPNALVEETNDIPSNALVGKSKIAHLFRMRWPTVNCDDKRLVGVNSKIEVQLVRILIR